MPQTFKRIARTPGQNLAFRVGRIQRHAAGYPRAQGTHGADAPDDPSRLRIGRELLLSPRPPLTLPITVLASHGDIHVDHNRVGAWRKETTRECRVCWFDGDHFFVHTQSAAVVDLVSAEFAETLCA